MYFSSPLDSRNWIWTKITFDYLAMDFMCFRLVLMYTYHVIVCHLRICFLVLQFPISFSLAYHSEVFWYQCTNRSFRVFLYAPTHTLIFVFSFLNMTKDFKSLSVLLILLFVSVINATSIWKRGKKRRQIDLPQEQWFRDVWKTSCW